MALVSTQHGAAEVVQVGAGRDVVLLHSLLSDLTAFDRVRPLLAPRFRLTLVNLPGYGASAPVGTTVEAYADQIVAAMDALNLPRATDVLGNGLGGFISVALALRHGDRFDRLIVVDAPAGFPEAGKAPLRALAAVVREKGMSAALDIAIQRMFPPAYIAAHPDVVQERKDALLQMNPDTFANLCLALTQVEFAAQLPRIRNRALVLAGELDATTAPTLVRQLAEGIPGARFVQVPGCGHCPQIEKPAEFVRLLTSFLEETA